MSRATAELVTAVAVLSAGGLALAFLVIDLGRRERRHNDLSGGPAPRLGWATVVGLVLTVVFLGLVGYRFVRLAG